MVFLYLIPDLIQLYAGSLLHDDVLCANRIERVIVPSQDFRNRDCSMISDYRGGVSEDQYV